MAYIDTLAEKRQNIWEQAKALLDHAESEKRELSAEESESYRKMSDDLTALRSNIDLLVKTEQENRDIEAALTGLVGKAGERKITTASDELRAFMRGEAGRSYDVPIEQRADLTTTTGAGVIPEGFAGQLWEYMVAASDILTKVDLINTTSGETIKFPRVTAYSTVASTAETVALTQSEPTLSSVNSTVSKQGYLVQISTELLTDSAFNLESYLAKWAGRELGNAVGTTAATVALAAASAGSTGSTGTTLGFGTQSTAGAGFDYIISLFHSVAAPYRNSASAAFVLADATAAIVRKIKSADGVYVWQPAVVAGQPDLILGKPVAIDNNIPVPAANAESILFGDFASVKTRIAGGFRFERSDDFAFNEDVSTFRAVVRHGSVSVDANALKSFTHSAT
jgi:HK97 family phage major capsid protein